MKRKTKAVEMSVARNARPEAKPALTLPRFSGWNRLLIYPFCVLSPGAGLLFAALYLKQDDRDEVRFGQICLALAILGGILRMCHVQNFQSLENSDALTQPYY